MTSSKFTSTSFFKHFDIISNFSTDSNWHNARRYAGKMITSLSQNHYYLSRKKELLVFEMQTCHFHEIAGNLYFIKISAIFTEHYGLEIAFNKNGKKLQ